MTVNLVTERHVVGRHRLGDRSRSTANTEKVSGYLLPGADFSKRLIEPFIKIDGKSFFCDWINRR